MATMYSMLSRFSWMQITRGVVAILFGILAFAWPGLTLFTLIILFGVYAIVSGLLAIRIGYQKTGTEGRWWPMTLIGIAGLLAGVLAFVRPGVTGLALLAVIAGWAIVSGFLEIVAAIRLRHEIEGEWREILAGTLSIIFGVLIATYPAAGVLAIVWLISVYVIVTGIVHIMLGLHMRRVIGDLEHGIPGARRAA